MFTWLFPLFCLLLEGLSARRDPRSRFLNAENRMLRARVPGGRVIPTPQERAQLLSIGAEFGHRIDHLITIVQAKTYRRWIREQTAGRPVGQVGRPRKISQEIRELIVRFAKENARWGYRRIVGELLKLHVFVGKTTVERILRERGISPEPDGQKVADRKDSTWETFLRLHLNTMVACDFFCKEIRTFWGRHTAYYLFFIHLRSRKVWVSPATYHPNDAWVRQQARNMLMWLDDHDVEFTHLIRDRDAKFSAGFDAIIESADARIVKTPVRAPNANAFSESWISRLRAECLNQFLCFSMKHLDFIVQTFARFHKERRPHQSKGNRVLTFTGDSPSPPDLTHEPLGRIRCQQELGGLLKHYARAA